MNRTSVPMFIAAGAFTCALAHAQATFTVVDVPQYYHNPVALCGDGRVLTGTTCGDYNCMFFWTREAGVVWFDPMVWTATDSVNDDGSLIAGFTGQQTGPDAALWDHESVRNLGKPSGVKGLSTVRISGDGRVIFASTYTDTYALGDAWRWTADKRFTSLDEGVPARVYAVSYDGSSAAGGALGGAAVWSEATGFVSIGVLPGGLYGARALAMTPDASVIVGESSSKRTSEYLWEPFLWTAQTGMVPLGDAPEGGPARRAGGVSADGRLIAADNGEDYGMLRAYLWDPDHGLRNLNDLLPALGADLGGWKLTAALQVSRDGRTLAGRAIPAPEYPVEYLWIATLCPPDCTEDGRLNINDFICFQSQWRQHTTYADYNRDGKYTVNDFLAFQSDFRRGCQ